MVNKNSSTTYSPVLKPDIENNFNTIPELTEKDKMFLKYFPDVDDKIEMDYPLKPIGCCPPSKELSTDLPVANIHMCYAAQSKTHLK
jgi:hypothetical protein